ncbi:unnamed protein product [Amoebophrya sp. A120]|nr:unnamed protein product [Amoebophrya sp. A120]|eukprot:GSA120T00013408001.1
MVNKNNDPGNNMSPSAALHGFSPGGGRTKNSRMDVLKFLYRRGKSRHWSAGAAGDCSISHDAANPNAKLVNPPRKTSRCWRERTRLHSVSRAALFLLLLLLQLTLEIILGDLFLLGSCAGQQPAHPSAGQGTSGAKTSATARPASVHKNVNLPAPRGPSSENIREDLILNPAKQTQYHPDIENDPFPDHDCRRVENPVIDWQRLRTVFKIGCPATKYTYTLQCSTMVTNWAAGLAFLEDWTDFPVQKGRKHDRVRKKAVEQCYLGYLTLMIVRLMQCMLKEQMGDCYLPYSVHVRELIRGVNFKVFLGTDWPVFALLNTAPFYNWPSYDKENLDFDCDKKSKSVVSWTEFRDLFVWPEDYRKHWFEESIQYYHTAAPPVEREVQHGGEHREQVDETGHTLLITEEEKLGMRLAFPKPLAYDEEKRRWLYDQRTEDDSSISTAAGYDPAEQVEESPLFISHNNRGPAPIIRTLEQEEELFADVSEHSFIRKMDEKENRFYYQVVRPPGKAFMRAVFPPEQHEPPDEYFFQTPKQAHFYSKFRSWWLDSIKFVYDKRISEDTATSSQQCLYGLYTANVIKALWAADTESSAFQAYAEHVNGMFFESLHFLGGSKWPIFALLEHGKSLRRHKFDLDFSRGELDLIWKDSGPWLQSLGVEEHGAKILGSFIGSALSDQDVLARPEGKMRDEMIISKNPERIIATTSTRAAGLKTASYFSHRDSHYGWRPSFVELVRQITGAVLQDGKNRETGRRLLYVSFVYGKYKKYIAGWTRRLKALRMTNFLFYCLDWDTYAECERVGDREFRSPSSSSSESSWSSTGNNILVSPPRPRCAIGETISSLNKFTIVLTALQLGFDVFWVDLDAYLVQDPTEDVYATLELGMKTASSALNEDSHKDDDFDFSKRYKDWAQRSDVGLYPLHGDAYSLLTLEGMKNDANTERAGRAAAALSSSSTGTNGRSRKCPAAGAGGRTTNRNRPDKSTTRRSQQMKKTTENESETMQGDLSAKSKIQRGITRNSRAEPFEMLISYSFISDCICNGFFFMKSTPRMEEWMKQLIIWLYHHPYEHDQRAMSAFLNYTEKVAFPKHVEEDLHGSSGAETIGDGDNLGQVDDAGESTFCSEQGDDEVVEKMAVNEETGADEPPPEETPSAATKNKQHLWYPPEVPHWFVFEPNNKYVNWPYWTGKMDEILLIHFLDGSAYSLYGRGDWDASIPVVAEHSAASTSSGPTDQHPAAATGSVDASSSQERIGSSGPGAASAPIDVEDEPLDGRMLDTFYEDLDSYSRRFSGREIRVEQGDEESLSSALALTPKMKRLLQRAREPEIVGTRQKCGILPNVHSAHEGVGWLDAEVRRVYPM